MVSRFLLTFGAVIAIGCGTVLNSSSETFGVYANTGAGSPDLPRKFDVVWE